MLRVTLFHAGLIAHAMWKNINKGKGVSNISLMVSKPNSNPIAISVLVSLSAGFISPISGHDI